MLKQAYYNDQISFETVETMLGTEEAVRLQLLVASLDRDAPGPQLEGTLPTQSDFYDGEIPEWQSNESPQ